LEELLDKLRKEFNGKFAEKDLIYPINQRIDKILASVTDSNERMKNLETSLN
jgi:hypothetical protein